MNKIDKIVGDILKQKRRELRMTQTQLGDKVGIHYSTVACYESGSRGMSLDMFFKFCDILKLDPNEIQKEVEKQLDDNA